MAGYPTTTSTRDLALLVLVAATQGSGVRGSGSVSGACDTPPKVPSFNCSLNGACQGGTCVCDSPWYVTLHL